MDRINAYYEKPKSGHLIPQSITWRCSICEPESCFSLDTNSAGPSLSLEPSSSPKPRKKQISIVSELPGLRFFVTAVRMC